MSVRGEDSCPIIHDMTHSQITVVVIKLQSHRLVTCAALYSGLVRGHIV